MIHLSGNPFMQTQHRSQPMRLNSCGRSRSFRAAFLHSTHRKCRRGGWHRKDGACKSLVAGPRQGRRLGRRRKRVCMVLLQSWPGHGSADLLRSVHQRSVQIFRPDAGPISARDKGRTLASAIRHQRTLLVPGRPGVASRIAQLERPCGATPRRWPLALLRNRPTVEHMPSWPYDAMADGSFTSTTFQNARAWPEMMVYLSLSS